jgi:hypothetical protein
MPSPKLPLARLLAVVLWLPLACGAALPDEIEVFDDTLAPIGHGREAIHLNTSPTGRTVPDYPGEIAPHRTWRTMLELSRGVADGLELGLHLPFLLDRDGRFHAAGLRPRLRWIPVRPADGSEGMFLGFNLEYSQVGRRFERPARHLEWKPIAGWRGDDWLLAANPTFTGWLSDGPRPKPEFAFNGMAKRRLAGDTMVGLEYYAAYGPLGDFRSPAERDRVLFVAADFTVFERYRVNAGIGRGLTPHADHTMLKFQIAF